MTAYRRGQTVTVDGSAWLATSDPTGVPGVDPAWSLVARGVPAPTPEGYVLTVASGKWQARPAPAGGGGGGNGSLLSNYRGDWANPSPAPVDPHPGTSLVSQWRGDWTMA